MNSAIVIVTIFVGWMMVMKLKGYSAKRDREVAARHQLWRKNFDRRLNNLLANPPEQDEQ